MSEFGKLKPALSELIYAPQSGMETLARETRNSFSGGDYLVDALANDLAKAHGFDPGGVDVSEYGKLASDHRDMKEPLVLKKGEKVRFGSMRDTTVSVPIGNVDPDKVYWDLPGNISEEQKASIAEKINMNADPVMNKETVNHPSHYGGDVKFEVIKVIDAWNLCFSLGNAIKYLARAGKKNDAIEDLRKARFYVEHERKKKDQVLYADVSDATYSMERVLENWNTSYRVSKAIEHIFKYAHRINFKVNLEMAVDHIDNEIKRLEEEENNA